MYTAIEFPENQHDLSSFSVFLHEINFPHRFSEHQDKVVLWVYEEDHIAMANDLYQRFLSKSDINASARHSVAVVTNQGLAKLLMQYPLTLILIFLCIAGFYTFFMQELEWVSLLSFQGLLVDGDNYSVNAIDVVKRQISDGQIWRLISPVFLHFDIMHVTFNATILWFLGHQIEKNEGPLMLLLLVFFTGVISNITQYYFSVSHLFGGMSGVNYGLMSYCAYKNFIKKPPLFFLPNGFLIVSVVMMLLGFLNIFALFGYSIANWAHLAGFISGLLLAMVVNKK